MQVSQFRALRRAQSTIHTPTLARALSAQSDVSVEVSEQKILLALDKFQKDAARNTVPWFLENMPPSYFRSIHEEDRLQHLNAITALVGAEQPEVLLRSPDQKVFSHFRSGANFPGRLANVLEQLPQTVDGAPLARVKIFTALDDSLGLDIFRFGQQEPFLNKTESEKQARARIQQFCANIQVGKYAGNACYPAAGPHFEPEVVDAYLNNSNTMYVQFSHPRRLAKQLKLYQRVHGTEGVAVDVEHKWETRSEENKFVSSGAPQTMLTIAASNVIPKSFMQKAATYLGLCNLNVVRAHLDVVKDPESNNGDGHVAMVRILVQPSEKACVRKFGYKFTALIASTAATRSFQEVVPERKVSMREAKANQESSKNWTGKATQGLGGGLKFELTRPGSSIQQQQRQHTRKPAQPTKKTVTSPVKYFKYLCLQYPFSSVYHVSFVGRAELNVRFALVYIVALWRNIRV